MARIIIRNGSSQFFVTRSAPIANSNPVTWDIEVEVNNSTDAATIAWALDAWDAAH